MNKYLFSAFFAFILTGCGADKHESDHSQMVGHNDHHESISDERTKDLMAIHDSIMPAMETLMNLKNQLSEKTKVTDSLLAIKPDAVLKSKKEQAAILHTQLEKADKEMMNWMHQYNADTLTKLEKKQAEIYIGDQKQKIIAVRDLMQKSIAEATLFIKTNK